MNPRDWDTAYIVFSIECAFEGPEIDSGSPLTLKIGPTGARADRITSP